MAEIERQFAGSDRTTALKTVNLFTGKPGERESVQLAIVGQSGGSLETLRALVDAAKRTPSSVLSTPSGRAVSQGVTDVESAPRAGAVAVAQRQGANNVRGADAIAPAASAKEYPPYRYLFYVAIAIIPVLTLGGAIPAAIAGAGIAGCRRIATDARQPHINRILFCIGITIACWVALFTLVGGVALLRSRR